MLTNSLVRHGHIADRYSLPRHKSMRTLNRTRLELSRREAHEYMHTCVIRIAHRKRCTIAVDGLKGGAFEREWVFGQVAAARRAARGNDPEIRRASVERETERDGANMGQRVVRPSNGRSE